MFYTARGQRLFALGFCRHVPVCGVAHVGIILRLPDSNTGTILFLGLPGF